MKEGIASGMITLLEDRIDDEEIELKEEREREERREGAGEVDFMGEERGDSYLEEMRREGEKKR